MMNLALNVAFSGISMDAGEYITEKMAAAAEPEMDAKLVVVVFMGGEKVLEKKY